MSVVVMENISVLHRLSTAYLYLICLCFYAHFNKRNISNHFQIGCDRSRNLLGVCRDRKFEAVNADCRRTPARDGCADAVICNVLIIYLLLYFVNDLDDLDDLVKVLR